MMKSIFKYIILLALTAFFPNYSYSQTEEIECLKTFNLLVHKKLSNLNTNNVDLSSNNLNIIFELYVGNCGKIDSIALKKSNLNTFAISESALITSLVGEKFPCIRKVYFKGELLPDKVIIVYNTKILEEK